MTQACLSKAYALGIKRPWIVLLCIAVFNVIILAAIKPVFKMIEQSNNDFLVPKDPLVQRHFSYIAGLEAFSDDTVVYDLRNRKQDVWTTIIVYEDLKGGNLLTRDGIAKLHAIEQKVLKDKDYDKFCLSTSPDGTCAAEALQSVVSQLAAAPDDAAFDVLLAQFGSQLAQTNIGSFFDTSFAVDNLKSSALRSFLSFGDPVSSGYQLQPDLQSEMVEFKVFAVRLIDMVKGESSEDLTVHLVGTAILQAHFGRAVDSDFLFAGGSFVFVFLYITFHTSSFWLSSMGMLGVMLAFPITYFFYRLLFGISFFNNMHLLMIFVMLGIGADDIFVFTDAWNQAPAEIPKEYKDLGARMAWTWRRAGKAMLVTSFTTAAAFFATATSPIMPISTFGIYAGLVVCINYLVVITYYPLLVLVWQQHLRHLCSSCSRGKTKVVPADETGAGADPSHNRIEIFFGGTWLNWVEKARFAIIVFFAVWIIVAGYLAAQMSPLSESEKFLLDSHPSVLAQTSLELFPASTNDAKASVQLVWGIKDIDSAGSDPWDPVDTGVVVWDDSFHPWDPAVQQYLADLGDELQNHSYILKGEAYCVMSMYKQFLGADFPLNVSRMDTNLTQKEAFTQSVKQFGKYVGLDAASGFGVDKSGVRMIFFSLPTDFELFQPRSTTFPEFEKWEAEMTKFNKEAPEHGNQGFQTTFFSWPWMATEEALAKNALAGMAISLAIAFVVLIVSTLNIVVGTLAIVCIVGIVTSVVACMHLQGWELGVAESISMVILVGFSVDYVVHLANSYVEADKTKSRRYRIQSALREMGISVVGGAISTFGSSLFLWGAQTQFFRKFAILLELTVFFSILWSLVFFPAASLVVGPEGTFGSLATCCKR